MSVAVEGVAGELITVGRDRIHLCRGRRGCGTGDRALRAGRHRGSLLRLETHAKRYRAAGARVDIIEGSGHSPNVEYPEQVAELLGEFLRSTAAS